MRLGIWVVLVAGCSGGGDDGNHTDDPAPIDATAYAELPIKSHFQWVDEEFESGRITYYVPPDPKAVLFALHGTDGGVDTVLQIEWLELYNLLYEQGFAFILSQSLDRDVKQWDIAHTTPDTNPDFQHLSRVRDHVIDETALEASTPVFAAGFSNGGAFAVLFTELASAEGWDVRGFLSHNSAYPVSAPVPGAYISAEHDEHNGTPDNVEQTAQQCSDFLGVTCPHFRGTEILLDPRRFARLPQYSLEQSQLIFDELVRLEYVDAAGARLAPLDDIDALMNQYMAETNAPIPGMPPTQLRVVWATHRVSSQHMKAEVAFLMDLL